MMTNKFKKLFEFFQQPQVKKLMKEVSGFGNILKQVICLMKVCMISLVH